MCFKLKLVLLFLQIVVSVNSRQFNPKTGPDFQKAIDLAKPGDTIQLEALDYEGDFVMKQNGEKIDQSKFSGESWELNWLNSNNFTLNSHRTEQDDGAATSQILGTSTGILVQGNFWFLKNLNITAIEEGLVIEGNGNHVESIGVHDASLAVAVLGNENEFGSISISDVKDGIIVQGNDNAFR